MIDRRILEELGIPADYGRRGPRLPSYADARELEDVEVNIVGRMQQLVPQTAKAWRAMKQAALEDDVQLLLVSGFRSAAYQIELFRKKLASGQDIGAILKVNAAPGFSQHHSGKAVDIATPGSRPLTEEFEHSGAFAWLQQHAARFEFVMPYGRDNAHGFIYEPWHWSQLPIETRRKR